MFKKFAIAAALALAASSSFAAAPTGYYGGLDVGSTKIDDFNDSKAGVGGFLGYGFNRFVAVELGYRQLGSWDIGGVDVTAKQAHVSVVGSYPLAPQFDIYGRLATTRCAPKRRTAASSMVTTPTAPCMASV